MAADSRGLPPRLNADAAGEGARPAEPRAGGEATARQESDGPQWPSLPSFRPTWANEPPEHAAFNPFATRSAPSPPASPLPRVVRELPKPRAGTGPRGARWDTKAVGVPRRFGLSVLFLVTTMYAVLFATMQVAGVKPVVFVVIAVFFTGVGVGQSVLFRGEYPRAASLWSGAVLAPVIAMALAVWYWGPAWFFAFPLFVSVMPIGAGFGYLAGGLTAGVFLLVEMFWAARGAAAEGRRSPERLQAGEP